MMEGKKITVQGETYYFIKDYKDQVKYRQSLNSLTGKTYGFNFEDWYLQGFWTDRYIPYSLIHQDQVVSNVSVNPIDYLICGRLIHTIQLGTVMTDTEFRNRGLSKALMNLVLQEVEGKYDFIYLYANDSVLNFYPKFGFTKAVEYGYSRSFTKTNLPYSFRKLNMKDSKDKEALLLLVRNTIPVSGISMVENYGLIMFYLTSFMKGDIYYCKDQNLAAVVQYDDDKMFLTDIFSKKEFDLQAVIRSLLKQEEQKVSLGFTPISPSGFQSELLLEEDTTFFIKGRNPLGFGRFPVLSHA